MQKFTEILKQATSRIYSQFFHLHLDGGDPVYRERVYCYELYHQLRCLWPQSSRYCLNGELDKAAHPILRDLGADYAKPDLLVHRPGDMRGNNTIIEVKSCNAKNDGICKDIDTLSLFLERVGYKRAIYLVFGYEAANTAQKIRTIANQLRVSSPIELWLHTEPQMPAVPNGSINSDWLTVC